MVDLKIEEFSLYRYKLPLADNPYLESREGIILKLRDDEGCTGWGDCAPLPGYSRESLEQSCEQLLTVKKGKEPEGLYPSVLFAVEQAMLTLMSQKRSLPMRRLFSENYVNQLCLNRLVSTEDPLVLDKVETFVQASGRTVKVKVGKKSWQEDLKILQGIAEVLGKEGRIRLDANGRWDIKTAIAFASKCSSLPIEYVEEPVADLRSLDVFVRATKLPIALDETFRCQPHLDLSRVKGLHTLILKPTLFGGLQVNQAIAKRVESLGIQVVISSSFESGLGLLGLANLAAAFTQGKTPVGLDTFSFFEDDVLTKPLFTSFGSLDLESLDFYDVDLAKSWIKQVEAAQVG